MVNVIPTRPKQKNRRIADKTRMYCRLLAFHEKDDSLSENIGISDTRRSEVAMAAVEMQKIRISAGTPAIHSAG